MASMLDVGIADIFFPQKNLISAFLRNTKKYKFILAETSFGMRRVMDLPQDRNQEIYRESCTAKEEA